MAHITDQWSHGSKCAGVEMQDYQGTLVNFWRDGAFMVLALMMLSQLRTSIYCMCYNVQFILYLLYLNKTVFKNQEKNQLCFLIHYHETLI